jgi:hypothetical protein
MVGEGSWTWVEARSWTQEEDRSRLGEGTAGTPRRAVVRRTAAAVAGSTVAGAAVLACCSAATHQATRAGPGLCAPGRAYLLAADPKGHLEGAHRTHACDPHDHAHAHRTRGPGYG